MGIMFPDLKLCCFYFPLKTGVKFFGFSSVVGCLLNAVLSGLEIVAITHYQGTDISEDTEEGLRRATVELSIDIVLQLIQTATSVLLLLAVYQGNPKLIPPWLVTTVMIALSEILFQPSFPGRMVGTHLYHYINTLKWAIFTAVTLVDDVYGWLVVFSYYRTISPQSGNIV